MSLAIIPLYLWTLLVLFLPGFALLAGISKKRQLSNNTALIFLFTTAGVLGYLAFWIYFANASVGKSFSFAVLAVSVFTLLRKQARSHNLRILSQIRVPLLYLAVVGSCYLSLLFLVSNPFPVGQDLMDWRFFSSVQPGDNVIPWYFAEKIYGGKPLIPFCCGDWLSSDRPPLQAGIFLFYWPFKLLGSAGLNYQILASGLQCSWILGIWTFLSALDIRGRRVTQVLGLLVPSAFLLYNTVYTWPKLLAATLLLFALSLLISAFRVHRSLNRGEVMLGATCLGLALMAHPGSVFSLPMFVLAIIAKWRPRWQHLAAAVVILAMFAIPWQMYQRYFDPPGNRLVKMHLAGSGAVDSRSTWTTLKDSYGALPWKQILLYKWLNIRYLLGPKPFGGFSLRPFHLSSSPHVDLARLESVRMIQKEYIWSALGFLNLGWLAAIYALRKRASEAKYAFYILCCAVANLFLWSLIIFGPAQTMTTHSSYADILVIASALSIFLTAGPGWIPFTVMILQALNTSFIWLWFVPESPVFCTSIQTPLLMSAILSGIGLLVHFGWACLFRSDGGQHVTENSTRSLERASHQSA